VDQIRVFADDRPEGRGPVGTCIREDHPVVYNHFLQDSRAAPWQELAAAYGLRSIAVTPLHFEGAVCGAFAVYAADADDFHDEELTLLAETAATISAALARLENDTKRPPGTHQPDGEGRRLELRGEDDAGTLDRRDRPHP
jgi:GAF domain-containing protein